jgi:ADP-heptose:LPS heptosyltransferase
MHLASIVNTPVISIWGATHPFAGFLGWGQSTSQVVQTDLSCRPCSVFGNKPCFRGDYACLQQIQPAHIVQQVRSYLCIS